MGPAAGAPTVAAASPAAASTPTSPSTTQFSWWATALMKLTETTGWSGTAGGPDGGRVATSSCRGRVRRSAALTLALWTEPLVREGLAVMSSAALTLALWTEPLVREGLAAMSSMCVDSAGCSSIPPTLLGFTTLQCHNYINLIFSPWNKIFQQ